MKLLQKKNSIQNKLKKINQKNIFRIKKYHTNQQFVWLIRIDNPYEPICMVIRIGNLYGSYGLTICMFWKKNYTSLLLWQWKTTELHCLFVNNARTPSETTNARKRRLTDASYTRGMRFKKKNRHYRNEKHNMLFITENTYKGIFSILKNC